MAIPTTIEDLSTTPASNGPSGSEQRTLADDGLRQAYAFIRMLVTTGSNIASASSITPPSTGSSFNITGTTAITAIASTNSWNGRIVYFIFAGALTLTHSSNLALPGATNITTAANDIAGFVQTASGAWRCFLYARDSNAALFASLVVEGAARVSSTNKLSFSNTAGQAYIYSPASSSIAIGAGSADAAYWDSSGNVGFGVTPSTGAKVEVSGGLQVRSTNKLSFTNTPGQTYIYASASNTLAFGTSSTDQFFITSDGRFYGVALHNNSGSVIGTTNQYIASGTYTPTLTSVANISATTARQCQWVRVGNVVTVSGQFDATHTATGTVASEVGVSLPIASSFTTAYQAGGTSNSYQSGAGFLNAQSIDADATNDRARVRWMNSAASGSTSYMFSFSYEVL